MQTQKRILDELELVPEFIQSTNIILVPKKTESVLSYISTEDLQTINKDIKVAKELCLYFLSLLYSNKYYENRYKRLHSKVLSDIFKSPDVKSSKTIDMTYKRIIDVLLKGTDNGPIIEIDNTYAVDQYSKGYSLTERYLKGFTEYKLKTKYAKRVKYRNFALLMAKAYTNDIAKNSLKMYGLIQLPTSEHLLTKGKELVKQNYITKKGKILTMRYRQDNSHWKDSENRSFVEDDIEMFEYYTKHGYIIPIIGGEHCPRVYDSINLLPSWVRNEIMLYNEKLDEADYSALHPNIIMNIYKGNTKYIDHQTVADYLGIDRQIAKIEHLSFFNKQIPYMYNSPLFKYYNDSEIEVLEKVIKDKNEFGYKYTSKQLFTIESELMEKVILECNKLNIDVIYVFDALLHSKEDKDVVNAIMNKLANDMNIFTSTGYFDDCTDYNTLLDSLKIEEVKTITMNELFN